MTPTHPEEHGMGGHVVPMRILIGTWAALVVLTWITVSATTIDLGGMNIVIALSIAVVKSVLVVLYFMHLKWDKPFHAIVFLSAALFVVLFITLALMDTKSYADSKIPGYAPEITEAAAATAAESAPADADAHGEPAPADADASHGEPAAGGH